jgi:alkyl sulfatase BDS1-like metallo-beta-lactamase superfamily hydrolase
MAFPNTFPPREIGIDFVRAMTLDMYFDLLAVMLDAAKAADKNITVDWIFTDTQQEYSASLENSVLHYKEARCAAAPDATIMLTREVLDKILSKQATFPGRMLTGVIKVEGSRGNSWR